MATFTELQATYDIAHKACTAIVDSDAPPAKRALARTARTKLEAEFLQKIEDEIGSADDLYRDLARQMQGVIDRIGKSGPTAALNTLTGIVATATKLFGPLDGDAGAGAPRAGG